MKQRPLLAYLVLVALISGGFVAGMMALGGKGTYLAGPYMLGPVLAALVTRGFFYEHGFKDARLHFGRWQDYLKFWGATLGIVALSYGVYTLLGAISWDFSGDTFLAKLEEQMAQSGQKMGDLPTGITPKMMLLIFCVGGLTIFNIPTVVFGFGEEFGWRGLMFPLLCRRRLATGFIVGGLIWFAWHVPLVLILPDTSGFTPWQHAVNAAILAMGATCTFVYFAYVYARTGTIWAAAFVHAVLNNGSRAFSYFAIVDHQLLANLGLALTMFVVLVFLHRRGELKVFGAFLADQGVARGSEGE